VNPDAPPDFHAEQAPEAEIERVAEWILAGKAPEGFPSFEVFLGPKHAAAGRALDEAFAAGRLPTAREMDAAIAALSDPELTAEEALNRTDDWTSEEPLAVIAAAVRVLGDYRAIELSEERAAQVRRALDAIPDFMPGSAT
jgi:hypothetical protein